MHLHLGLKQEENIHGNAVNSAYQNLDQAANCTIRSSMLTTVLLSAIDLKCSLLSYPAWSDSFERGGYKDRKQVTSVWYYGLLSPY